MLYIMGKEKASDFCSYFAFIISLANGLIARLTVGRLDELIFIVFGDFLV